GQGRGLRQVVGGEQDGGAAVRKAGDEVPELAPCLRVEAGGRLVEEEQLRVPDDAQRDIHPAALPAGELLQLGARLLSQPDGLDTLAGAPRIGVLAGETTDQL